MSRISEQELVIPALRIIDENPGISTSDLISKLTDELRPAGEDLEILGGRSDTKFSQKVRNLVAHKTLDQRGPGYTEYKKSGANGYHWITPKGLVFLRAFRDPIDYLIEHGFEYADIVDGLEQTSEATRAHREIIVYPEDLQVSEGARRRVTATVFERSRRLREAAIQHYSRDGSITCEACGFDFAEQYGEIGEGFIEMHHRKPLFQYGGQETSDFIKEAIKDLAPLCSNCHRMIHRNRASPLTVDELRDRLHS